VGDGSPGLREVEGEGGEGFYIARSGSKFDLLVISGEEGATKLFEYDDIASAAIFCGITWTQTCVLAPK
jgi:hypothetical protein